MIIVMEESCSFWSIIRSVQQNDNNRNLVSAFFHMLTIALLSTSLVQLSWFQITGGFCVPHLAVRTFFTSDYLNALQPRQFNIYNQAFEGPMFYTDHGVFESTYRCVTPKIVNMMRILILLCFMAIIFSFFGFLLDILGLKSKIYEFIRKNSIAGTCTVLWIFAVMTMSYYVAYSIEDSIKDIYSDMLIQVNFEYGFYAVVTAGAFTLIGIICNLFLHYIPYRVEVTDQRYLINDWEDVESYPMPPPPPYSAPPPPYTP